MRGPQYGATAIGALDSGVIDRQPDNLLNDILAPVPRLGKSFRDATTSVKFSYVVRGDARFVDTAPPLLIEIMMTVGPLFILPTFLAFGVFVGWVERRWVTAQSPLTTYCWMFLGLWSGYLLAGSAQFLVQAMIYFGLPIFFAVVLIQRWQLVSGDQLSAHRQVFQQ